MKLPTTETRRHGEKSYNPNEQGQTGYPELTLEKGYEHRYSILIILNIPVRNGFDFSFPPCLRGEIGLYKGATS
jgi:hypothetical protein